MRVAKHRDGTDLDYNEANGLFSMGDVVVTVQQVAKFDRGRKLNWSKPENREWFRRMAAVDNVSIDRPRKGRGCLIALLASAITACALLACVLATCTSVASQTAQRLNSAVPASSTATPTTLKAP